MCICIFKKVFLAIGLCFITIMNCYAQSDTEWKLWYNKPAQQWVEALPIGNGRLGAMVFGNPENDKVQLNESTVWAGQPNRNDNPEAKESLPKVRQLIFQGKYNEAQNLVNQKFISKLSNGMPYQTVGNLNLRFPGHENFHNYYRELNIENAIATTVYTVGGTTYKREVFSSIVDQVIVIRLTADRPRKISFSTTMERPSAIQVAKSGNDKLILSGTTSDFETIKGMVQFSAQVKIIPEGGSILACDTSLTVNNANAATIYISIATNFKNYADISGDAIKKANGFLKSVVKKTYTQVLKDHIKEYQKFFNRVKIDLGHTESIKNPTDVRIKQFVKSYDPQLVALYFQFGRYLLISSSQPGGQPATLQGLWNGELFPPWDSKYTVNINTEMNYWPSEVTNLTEMNEPLIQMIRELSETGKQTAKSMYGADGWVLHHNTDIWRINGPVDGSYWGMWPMGGAWLCQHLWYKYEYSGKQKFLASVYPILKSAASFYISFLSREPKHNWLVVVPSISPENAPMQHSESSISAGTTMDNELLFDLFSKTIKSAEILGLDKEFVIQLKATISQLPPMQIGQYAQLQEWMEDRDDPMDKHRHVSHLYAVYPSNQISPYRTPELFTAARNSLSYRGDPSTGWSMNWKINLWARFLDGNHAYKLITDQISLVDSAQYKNHDFAGKGGTYPNMLDACPPFQIDGNFGFTAGLAEMLLQSHDGAIQVLPALPDVLENGSVSGLLARGGFVIENMEWKAGKITKLVVKSTIGGNCRIRSYSELKTNSNIKLVKAIGENSNPFYQTTDGKKPIISDKAKLKVAQLKENYLYDIPTKIGMRIVFTSN